jgi:hypothetical protein
MFKGMISAFDVLMKKFLNKGQRFWLQLYLCPNPVPGPALLCLFLTPTICCKIHALPTAVLAAIGR